MRARLGTVDDDDSWARDRIEDPPGGVLIQPIKAAFYAAKEVARADSSGPSARPASEQAHLTPLCASTKRIWSLAFTFCIHL